MPRRIARKCAGFSRFCQPPSAAPSSAVYSASLQAQSAKHPRRRCRAIAAARAQPQGHLRCSARRSRRSAVAAQPLQVSLQDAARMGVGIDKMTWESRSTDLLPVENVVGRQVAGRRRSEHALNVFEHDVEQTPLRTARPEPMQRRRGACQPSPMYCIRWRCRSRRTAWAWHWRQCSFSSVAYSPYISQEECATCRPNSVRFVRHAQCGVRWPSHFASPASSSARPRGTSCRCADCGTCAAGRPWPPILDASAGPPGSDRRWPSLPPLTLARTSTIRSRSRRKAQWPPAGRVPRSGPAGRW